MVSDSFSQSKDVHSLCNQLHSMCLEGNSSQNETVNVEIAEQTLSRILKCLFNANSPPKQKDLSSLRSLFKMSEKLIQHDIFQTQIKITIDECVSSLLGSPSLSQYYANVLPQIETVQLLFQSPLVICISLFTRNSLLNYCRELIDTMVHATLNDNSSSFHQATCTRKNELIGILKLAKTILKARYPLKEKLPEDNRDTDKSNDISKSMSSVTLEILKNATKFHLQEVEVASIVFILNVNFTETSPEEVTNLISCSDFSVLARLSVSKALLNHGLNKGWEFFFTTEELRLQVLDNIHNLIVTMSLKLEETDERILFFQTASAYLNMALTDYPNFKGSRITNVSDKSLWKTPQWNILAWHSSCGSNQRMKKEVESLFETFILFIRIYEGSSSVMALVQTLFEKRKYQRSSFSLLNSSLRQISALDLYQKKMIYELFLDLLTPPNASLAASFLIKFLRECKKELESQDPNFILPWIDIWISPLIQVYGTLDKTSLVEKFLNKLGKYILQDLYKCLTNDQLKIASRIIFENLKREVSKGHVFPLEMEFYRSLIQRGNNTVIYVNSIDIEAFLKKACHSSNRQTFISGITLAQLMPLHSLLAFFPKYLEGYFQFKTNSEVEEEQGSEFHISFLNQAKQVSRHICSTPLSEDTPYQKLLFEPLKKSLFSFTEDDSSLIETSFHERMDKERVVVGLKLIIYLLNLRDSKCLNILGKMGIVDMESNENRFEQLLFSGFGEIRELAYTILNKVRTPASLSSLEMSSSSCLNCKAFCIYHWAHYLSSSIPKQRMGGALLVKLFFRTASTTEFENSPELVSFMEQLMFILKMGFDYFLELPSTSNAYEILMLEDDNEEEIHSKLFSQKNQVFLSLNPTWKSIRCSSDLYTSLLPHLCRQVNFQSSHFVSYLLSLGETYVTMIRSIVHWGVVTTLVHNLEKLCVFLLSSNIPEWMAITPKLLKECLSNICNGTLEEMTRIDERSIGLPYCLLSIMTSMLPSKSAFFQGILDEGLETLYRTADPDHQFPEKSKVTSLVTLSLLVKSAQFFPYLQSKVFEYLEISLRGLLYQSSSVQSSSAILFESLITKIFGPNEESCGHQEGGQRRSFEEFFLESNHHRQRLKDTCSSILETSVVALHRNNFRNHFQTSKGAFAVLLFLSKLQLNSNLDDETYMDQNGRHQFYNVTESLLSSPIYKIREQGARVMLILTPSSLLLEAVIEILMKIKGMKEKKINQNQIHGYIAFLQTVVQQQSCQTTVIGVISSFCNEMEPWFKTQDWHPSGIIMKRFLHLQMSVLCEE